MCGFFFQRLIDIVPLFVRGALRSGAVSGLGILFATVLGFLMGMMRGSQNKLLAGIIGVYVAVIRGTPFVVQIFIVFFIFPEWGIQLEAFPAAVLALSILGTAFICEIVAGGIKAVDRGQWEAAASSGLTLVQQLRFVILPQALQTILPPLVGQYVLMVKDSSVVSVIGVVELTRVGWVTVVRIPEGLMVFSLVGLFYFVICYPMIRLSNTLERKFALGEMRL